VTDAIDTEPQTREDARKPGVLTRRPEMGLAMNYGDDKDAKAAIHRGLKRP